MESDLRAIGQYESFLYTGRQAEAMTVLKNISGRRAGVKDNLEKMFRHYLPSVIASGAPNMPYDQLIGRYQQEVRKMGQNYLDKLNPKECQSFIDRFRLPQAASSSLNPQLAKLIGGPAPSQVLKTDFDEIGAELSAEEMNWMQAQSNTGVDGGRPANEEAVIVDEKAWKELSRRADIDQCPENSIFQIISGRYQKTFYE